MAVTTTRASVVVLLLFVTTQVRAATKELSLDAACKALSHYEYGQDMAPLLAIDHAAIEAMSSPQNRAALAARLAGVLKSPETTAAARQYLCLKLRDVGTAAEVPVLADMLLDPQTSQLARYALEATAGEQSAAALRRALTVLEGEPLLGVINSLGVRQDVEATAALQALAASKDERVSHAALRALGNIASDEAVTFLNQLAERTEGGVSNSLSVPLLRCAHALATCGKADRARTIYTMLSQRGENAATRRAALEGVLRLDGDQPATIILWFSGDDPQRQFVAAGHLARVPTEQLEPLVQRLSGLSDAGKLALLEVLAARKHKDVLPLLMSLAKSDTPALRLCGIHCLGMLREATAVPYLIDLLAAGGDVSEAAQQALGALPPKIAKQPLLAALNDRPELRKPLIEILTNMRCYEAIDPLIKMAASDDPAVYGPALEGLRGIADPDRMDLTRLAKLVTRVPRGSHRDDVERAIVIVCDKLPAGVEHAEPVLTVLGKMEAAQRAEYLPLLGRLGGTKVLDMIRSDMASDRPEIRDAAVRGLCNWPNADVADQLLEITGRAENQTHRRWALRAYVRVITLKSARPAAETLAMLKKGMQLAPQVDDKRLIIERVGTIRTLASVLWLAPYLDDAELNQAACAAILEAAHDRSLRSTNESRVRPILEKVARISSDPAVKSRAQQYLLGL